MSNTPPLRTSSQFFLFCSMFVGDTMHSECTDLNLTLGGIVTSVSTHGTNTPARQNISFTPAVSSVCLIPFNLPASQGITAPISYQRRFVLLVRELRVNATFVSFVIEPCTVNVPLCMASFARPRNCVCKRFVLSAAKC